MKNTEELFKKVNKENIELKEHKKNLRKYLLKSDYFNSEKEYCFNFKLAFTSVAFSFVILLIVFIYFSQDKNISVDNFNVREVEREMMFETLSLKQVAPVGEVVEEENLSYFEELINKDNVKIIGKVIWQDQEVFAIELKENNLKTTFYFNKGKNILLGSEVFVEDNK